jgi:hypothetical protein
VCESRTIDRYILNLRNLRIDHIVLRWNLVADGVCVSGFDTLSDRLGRDMDVVRWTGITTLVVARSAGVILPMWGVSCKVYHLSRLERVQRLVTLGLGWRVALRAPESGRRHSHMLRFHLAALTTTLFIRCYRMGMVVLISTRITTLAWSGLAELCTSVICWLYGRLYARRCMCLMSVND